MNTSTNPDFPYWKYDRFCLEELNEDECKSEFRFLKNDIYALHEVMNIPEEFLCYNGVKFSGIEGLCILLKRFTYPCRLGDMIPKFARPVPQLSMIWNQVMDYSTVLLSRTLKGPKKKFEIA